MTFFPGKIFIFTPKISHDRFFSHRPVFHILRFFTVLNVVYDTFLRPFLHKKNHYFRKEFLDKTIFYSVRASTRIRQHYFSKYWGGPMYGPSPHLEFGGRPPVLVYVSAPATCISQSFLSIFIPPLQSSV